MIKLCFIILFMRILLFMGRWGDFLSLNFADDVIKI